MWIHRQISPVGEFGALVPGGRRCPRCSEHVIAPDRSEFVEGGQIRHHWTCDNCGYAFSTALQMKAFAEAE